MDSVYLKSFVDALEGIIDIPRSEMEKIPRLFQPHHFRSGDFFVHAGDIPTQLGFVVKGLFRLYYLTLDGVEFTKSFCTENEFLGAYSAFLRQEECRLYIEALEDSTMLLIDYAALHTLFSSHPCWMTLRCYIAEQLFIKKERRESELLLDDAQTRYLKFLAEYPNLESRLKQYQIANYIGITPISLSRIRSQLKNLT